VARNIVKVNRAPVLTLWAAVVAERLGYERDTALSFGGSGIQYRVSLRACGLGAARSAEPGWTWARGELHLTCLTLPVQC